MSTTVSQPTRTQRPTIISVAKHAGVSKSLASRALRGEAGVSRENRQRVMEAAEELGYRLNSAARSLVARESGVLGVVLNDIGNAHHAQIVTGVETAARQHGLRTLITHGARHPDELVHQTNTLLEMQVDGLIVVSSWMPEATLQSLGDEVPTVVVAHLANPPSQVDLVASDDFAGSTAAAAHLLQIGRSRVAYLTRSMSATSKARWHGIRAQTQAAGVEPELLHFSFDDISVVRNGLAARRWDGIVTNNDQTAAEVLKLAHQTGVQVPTELAIVGYDNTPLAELLYPSLTSVDQPQQKMGQRALELLLQRQSDRAAPPVRDYYTPALVLRDSTRVQFPQSTD